MVIKHTPGPWYYVSGAIWTTLDGPDGGGQCIAQRASAATIPPTEKDANLRLASGMPALLESVEGLLCHHRLVENMTDTLEDRIDAVRTAIRKAKGRE